MDNQTKISDLIEKSGMDSLSAWILDNGKFQVYDNDHDPIIVTFDDLLKTLDSEGNFWQEVPTDSTMCTECGEDDCEGCE